MVEVTFDKKTTMKTNYLIWTMALVAWATGLQAQHQDSINWPADYTPAQSRFFVHNEIFIRASASTIWQLLIDAEAWPYWYPGAQQVEILQDKPRLTPGGAFTWKTMGLHFTSTIQEFQAPVRLSWESKKKSIQGYHAWLIIPEAGGCRVITDESQNGWLTFFEKTFQGKKLKRLHDIWLQELKKRAEEAEGLAAVR